MPCNFRRGRQVADDQIFFLERLLQHHPYDVVVLDGFEDFFGFGEDNPELAGLLGVLGKQIHFNACDRKLVNNLKEILFMAE